MFLPFRIAGGWVRCTKPHVIEVLTRDRRSRVIADREPLTAFAVAPGKNRSPHFLLISLGVTYIK
jgi:hypothetical protein